MANTPEYEVVSRPDEQETPAYEIVSRPGTGNTVLANIGLDNDMYAADLLAQIEAEQDPVKKRRLTAKLAGYAEAGTDIDPGFERNASRAEAALRGAGQGIFGVGDYAAAVGNTLRQLVSPDDSDMSFRDNLEFQRGRRERMQRRDPVSSGAGFVTGAVGGGGGVASGTTRAASKLPVVGDRIRRLFQGQTNTLIGRGAQAAAGGAASGGAAAFIESDGDVGATGRGVATGAVAGPVGEGVVRSGARLAQAAINRARPFDSGLRALAKRLQRTPEELDQFYTQFKQETGRVPRLAEVLSQFEAEEIAPVLAQNQAASRTMREAVEEAAVDRQRSMADAINTGGDLRSASALQNQAKDKFKAFFDKVKDTDVAVRPDELDVLLAKENRQAFSPNTQAALERAVNAARDDTGQIVDEVALSTNVLDNMRQELSAESMKGAGNTLYMGPATLLKDILEDAHPGYAQELDDFAKTMGRAEGVAAGRQALSTGDPQDAIDAIRAGSDELQQGAEEGFEMALIDKATKGPVEATRTAKQLAQSDDMQFRVEGVRSPQEAARLRNLGARESEAAASLTSATPRTRTMSEEQDAAASEAIRGIVLAGGRASGAFQANFARNLLGYVDGNRVRAQRLAAALTSTDEDVARRAIARMKEITGRDDILQQLYRDSAIASGIVAAQDITEEQ